MNAPAIEAAIQPPRWYVARTNPHQEKLARSALLHERLDAYLPMTFKTNRKSSELYAVPLFPGFLFVRVSLGASGWTKVFSARGVSSVLGVGGRPSAMRDSEVDWIRACEMDVFGEHGLKPPECAAFEEGQLVRIIKGPFELQGIFQEQVDARRCALLITILGAQRRAEVDTTNLEAVG